MGFTCRSREMDLGHEMRYLELDNEYGVRAQPRWPVLADSLIEFNWMHLMKYRGGSGRRRVDYIRDSRRSKVVQH